MFGLFKRKKTETVPDVAFGDVEVEDLEVSFIINGGNVLTKNFISSATFYPPASDRADGVCVANMDDRLAGFMERWKNNEFAVIGDNIVTFMDFRGAKIARNKRTVRVRVRSCVA